MRWPSAVLLLLTVGIADADDRGFLLGGGLETDSDDGLRGSLLAGIELTDATWLSAGVSASSVELASGRSSDIRYGDLDIDHYFNPAGVTLGIAYWGDPDLLDSVDLRTSVYFRNDKFSIAGEYEYRDFDFIIPPSDFFPGREFAFDADGIGARARLKFSDAVSMGISGMRYDYSVDFRPNDNRDVLRLITLSRFSLLSNLIDSRTGVDVSFAAGSSLWELDFSTWKGALDRSRTESITLRYLRPISNRSDIEFGLGYDDSDLYGDVTFLSVFLYFYGS